MPRIINGAAVAFVCCVSGCASAPAALRTQPESASTQATNAAPTSCRTDQLALDYRGGGYATQSDSGSLVIRDRSDTACRIAGTIVVVPHAADGALIKLAPLEWHAPPTTLSAGAHRWPDGQPPPSGAVVLILALQGWAVDQASGGNAPCRPVTPATWTATIHATGSIATPNADPGLTSERGVARSLFGCGGHILAEGFIDG